jgi:hypothetical protein
MTLHKGNMLPLIINMLLRLVRWSRKAWKALTHGHALSAALPSILPQRYLLGCSLHGFSVINKLGKV